MGKFSVDVEVSGKRFTVDLEAADEKQASDFVARMNQSEIEKLSSPTSKSEGGILNALTTKDLEGASKFDPLAQAARLGQFANKGNQDLASTIAEQSGRAGAAMDRLIPGLGTNVKHAGIGAAGTLATASEFLIPQTRLGVAGYAVQPVMKGVQALKGPVKGVRKPGIVAQLGQARSKTQAADLQQAIDDPSVFSAPSVPEANKLYGESAGNLKSAARSMREQTGKTLLSESDWNEAINRPGRILAGAEVDATGKPVLMDGQTALEGVQSINRFMRNRANTSKLDKEQISELLKQKEELITWLEGNGTPGMRSAAAVLRKAHVKENLSKILPQNKYGGTDALRTMIATGTGAAATGIALGGNPLIAAPMAMEAITASPAFWGGAIRNYHSITNPNVVGPAAALAALRARRGE